MGGKLFMKLNKLLVLILGLFVIAIAINGVNAAQIDNATQALESVDSQILILNINCLRQLKIR